MSRHLPRYSPLVMRSRKKCGRPVVYHKVMDGGNEICRTPKRTDPATDHVDRPHVRRIAASTLMQQLLEEEIAILNPDSQHTSQRSPMERLERITHVLDYIHGRRTNLPW